MQRTNSQSSGGSGSTGFTSNSAWSGASSGQGECPADGGGDADVAQELAGGSLGDSMQEATFGVLYTLSKEKFAEGWRWVLITMVVDYLQIAMYFIGSSMMWTMNFHAWYWKWLSWICFTNMFPPGTGLGNGSYVFYQVVFYALTVILVASFVLCIFVGHSFKTGTFPWLWPIKVLKVAVSFFFEIFYISALGIFSVSLDCTYYRPGPKTNEKFPQVQCFTMPHLAAIIVSVVASALAMFMAFFVSVSNSELNPLARLPGGQAHHRSSVKRFALVSILTLVNELFPSYTKLQSVVCLLITFYLGYNYIRYVPFQTPWVNGLQASFFNSLAWASLVILLAAFVQPGVKPADPLWTYLLWAGMLPAVACGWGLLYYRLRWAHRVALRYHAALATKQRVVHRFFDELEVEVVARCGRIADQWGEPVPQWIDTAEAVLQAGLEQFPQSAYLHILYSSFLIEARKQFQRATGMLEQSRKLEPGIGERFMLFVRDREQKQRQGSGGADGSYDLLSYVEFQNSYRAVVDSHTGALKAIRNFWRQLVRRDVKFEDLTRAFASMDVAEKRAELTYKTVLDKYSSSAKLLRAYGRFLEDVRSNPWAALRYYAEADKLELEAREGATGQVAGEGEGGGSEGDRSLNQMVDDSADAVVVSNDLGIIQFANKPVSEMFGWGVSELQGKNINVLMGPPAAAHHNQYLQRYKKTGKCTVMNTTRLVVALHKEGHSFPLTLSLKEVKQGDTKAYMAIMRPVREEGHRACVWVGAAGQVVGVDKGFEDLLGWTMQDLHGQLAAFIGADDAVGAQCAAVADQLKKWEFREEDLGKVQRQFRVRLRHKYGAAVEVDGEAAFAGSASLRTVQVSFTLDERVEGLGLVSVNAGGAIMYCNAAFEAMLGFETGALLAKRQALTDLVKGPAAKLLPRWLAAYARDPAVVAPSSCRTGRTVVLAGHNNREVPVRLSVEICSVGKMKVLTATVQKVPVPPADAWGGGDVKDMLDGAKRLLLLVRGDGRICAVKADPEVLAQGFGQDAGALARKTLADLVPDLQRPAGHHGAWPSQDALLQRLAAHASAHAGSGMRPAVRVGVLPDSNTLSLRARMALGSGGIIACRLVVVPAAESEVDVLELVDEGHLSAADVAVEGGLHVVELWREDLLDASLEVDAALKIKAMDGEAAMLCGLSREAVKSKPVLSLLKPLEYHLPHNARCEDFLGIKRSQLKRTADASASDKQAMELQHADGSTVAVQVQGCDRHGDGSRWALRVTVASAQPAAVRPSLLEVLEGRGGHRHHSAGDSSESDDGEDAIAAEELRLEGAAAAGPAKKAASEASASEKDGASSVGDGQSSMGASSEGAAASSDFQRAKRFKKLNRLLNSPQARVVLNALHRWSAVMLAAIVLLHIVLFAVTYRQIQGYNEFLKNTISSGEAATMAQKLLYASRVKMSSQDTSNVFSYYNANSSWAAELAAEFTPFVLRMANQVDDRVRAVYMGTSDKKQVAPKVPARVELFVLPQIPVVQMVQVSPEPYNEYKNASLWDFSRRFTTAARHVAVPSPDMADELANYSEYNYMRSNQAELSAALVSNLAMAEDRAQIGLAKQIGVMAAFMGVEAGFFVPACCFVLFVLLKLVNRVRVRTFNVFVVLPRPVVMQLAAKEVKLRLDDEQEDEEGDDADDAWLLQQQQAGGAAAADASFTGSPGKAGYQFSSQRRKLVNTSLDAYKMLVAFMLWAATVLVVYGVSIVLLRASIKPVADLTAAQKLHYLTSRLLYTTQKLSVSDSAAAAASFVPEVMEAASSMEEYKEALLYGNTALGLTGSILVGGSHEALWFGTGCMKRNASECYAKGHPYYEPTNFGLNRLLNKRVGGFVDSSLAIARDSFEAQSLSNPNWVFMWEVGQEGGDLDDALLANSADYMGDGKKRMLTVSILQILALVALFLITSFFWIYQLRPFMRRAKQESRRVAELLSQLPPEMAVEELVQEAANMAGDESKEEDKLRRKEEQERRKEAERSAAQGAKGGASGGGDGWWFGRGKAKVAPAPAGKDAGGAGFSIVVSTRTSKDKEAAPGGGAGAKGVGIDAAGAGSAASPPASGRAAKAYGSYHERLIKKHEDNYIDATDDPAILSARRSPRKISWAAAAAVPE